LPGPIYDERGRIVAQGGQVLGAEDLNSLPEGLCVGPEWPETQPSSPSGESDAASVHPGHEVVEELLLQQDVTSGSEKRRCARHAYRIVFRVILQEHQRGAVSERWIQVETNDISRAGFSFFYRQYVAVGTTLRAQFNDLPNRPTVLGVVRDCCLVEGRKHRVGVQFLERCSP
jgi:hypothetical protein